MLPNGLSYSGIDRCGNGCHEESTHLTFVLFIVTDHLLVTFWAFSYRRQGDFILEQFSPIMKPGGSHAYCLHLHFRCFTEGRSI